MNVQETAEAIKDYLINLALTDRLPLDMTLLSTQDLISVIQGTMPTERQRIIEAASHYLSDGDLTTAEMIEAIAKHDDETDLIDNLEGVVVWQKVENSFTCEDFLNFILFNDAFYDK